MSKVTADWSKYVCAGIVGAFVATSINLASHAATDPKNLVLDHLTVREIVLVDSHGSMRGFLQTLDDGSAQLLLQSVNTRAQVQASPTDAVVDLTCGNQFAALAVDTITARVGLHSYIDSEGSKDRTGTQLMAGKEAAFLGVTNPDGSVFFPSPRR
jgi:hypothetical protein